MKKAIALILFALTIVLSAAPATVFAETTSGKKIPTDKEIDTYVDSRIKDPYFVHDRVVLNFTADITLETALEIIRSEWILIYPDRSDDFEAAHKDNSKDVFGETITVEITVKDADIKAFIKKMYRHEELKSAILDVLDVPDRGLLGDIDASGKIDAADVLYLKRIILGTFDKQYRTVLADIDSSGSIDAVDYLLLKRAYLGTYTLPVL